MIYVTGDCHADWIKFSTMNFPEQEGMTREDFVIVCGDFGIWHSNKTEKWWFKWFEDKPFTILFVDGNHENFDRLYSDEFPVVDFHGGKAHKICENVYHLMRGYVFNLCDKKFFTFGGASSHDIDDGILDRDDFVDDEDFIDTYHKWERQGKMFRVNHISWWKEEMPSDEEMEFGLKTLAENGNKVDYIISHCAPQEAAAAISHGAYKKDKLTMYFNEIAHNVDFKRWFFGHYHDNRNVLQKYALLYEQIIRII